MIISALRDCLFFLRNFVGGNLEILPGQRHSAYSSSIFNCHRFFNVPNVHTGLLKYIRPYPRRGSQRTDESLKNDAGFDVRVLQINLPMEDLRVDPSYNVISPKCVVFTLKQTPNHRVTARMKNHVEEVKLQKVLANIEVGRRIKKIMLNMELFEDRKIAHKLKQEVSDVEAKKKKDVQKFIIGRQAFSTSGFFSSAKVSRPSTMTNTDPAREIMTAPSSGITRTAIYPVTKGKVSTVSSTHCHKHNIQNENNSVELTPCPKHQGSSHVYHVVITVDDADTVSPKSGRNFHSTRDITSLHDSSSPCHLSTTNNSSKRLEISTPAVSNRCSNVSHLPPTIQTEAIDFDKVKRPATIPLRQTQRATDARSIRTLPNLSSKGLSASGSRSARPKTSILWPGDPNAIRSVRRNRKRPEEMLSLVKNGEEARRMIREMPPTCSKNCSKPDILQELGRSYTDLPNLLPAIEQARHDMAKKEAIEREITQDNLVEAEIIHQPMPVCQVQYSALRSLGGVRRNSVLV